MPRPYRNPDLLPLAFGDGDKTSFSGLREFAEMLQQSGYRVLDLATVGGLGTLAVETAFVNLPSVTLLAISSSAHRVMTQRGGRVSLCFGVAGSGTLTAGQSEVAYHRDAGVLMPEAPVMWRIESCASDFEVSLDPNRLSATARVMLGLEEDGPLPGWNIDDLRPVPTKAGVVNGLAALISVAIQADRYKSQPRVLAASGLEDQCYRQAVFLLAAEAFLRPPSRAAAIHSERPAIDRLCEWLRANLYLPLTLTDFERFSGLAARTLQVSFRKRFGISPMAWFREQRLLAARSMLEHMRGTDSEAPLQALTASCGFVSVADLRRRYRARFGESPAVPPGPAE